MHTKVIFHSLRYIRQESKESFNFFASLLHFYCGDEGLPASIESSSCLQHTTQFIHFPLYCKNFFRISDIPNLTNIQNAGIGLM